MVIASAMLLSWKESDQTWHGACLALAEFARRRLISLNHIAVVVESVVKALHYELRRGHARQGGHTADVCALYVVERSPKSGMDLCGMGAVSVAT